jgi:hypothetical protein
VDAVKSGIAFGMVVATLWGISLAVVARWTGATVLNMIDSKQIVMEAERARTVR